ncbi:MAG: glutathione S-transferase C-terminal domain-containing protein, partial [Opitutae bacterium]
MSAEGLMSKEQTSSGEFVRQEDEFRGDILPDDAESGRYHLYVSLACPWAHRTLIFRKLLGLEEIISASVVDPIRDNRGWRFGKGNGFQPDSINGFSYLSEAYMATNPSFTGRVTVPVLWDKKRKAIVNNSEDDICYIFQRRFAAADAMDYFPQGLAQEQAELSEFIYERINNGVYKAGFATTQAAYEKAVSSLFEALEIIEDRLSRQKFLLGNKIVETDWRLFCTLIRFDAVYFGHFKCNLKRIVDYPNMQRFLKELCLYPGIMETVN